MKKQDTVSIPGKDINEKNFMRYLAKHEYHPLSVIHFCVKAVGWGAQMGVLPSSDGKGKTITGMIIGDGNFLESYMPSGEKEPEEERTSVFEENQEKTMKQQILCPACRKETRERFKTDNPFPGEHIKFVDGKAVKDFVCDHCDKKIDKASPCCAYSIWADSGAQPYYEWEHDYLNYINIGDQK